MARQIKQWITVNGVHVPIFEGESKADGVKRAIEKAKSNAKANENQKEKDIAKNKAEKDKLNEKETSGKEGSKYTKEEADEMNKAAMNNAFSSLKEAEAHMDRIREDEDKSANYRVVSKDGKYLVVRGDEQFQKAKDLGWKHQWQYDQINKKEGSLSDASSGKAVDNERVGMKELKDAKVGDKIKDSNGDTWKKTDDWEAPWRKEGSTDKASNEYLAQSKDITASRFVNTESGKAVDEVRGKKESNFNIKVPASFAANYPNLSSTELKKKYEEFLKKNRKK